MKIRYSHVLGGEATFRISPFITTKAATVSLTGRLTFDFTGIPTFTFVLSSFSSSSVFRILALKQFKFSVSHPSKAAISC